MCVYGRDCSFVSLCLWSRGAGGVVSLALYEGGVLGWSRFVEEISTAGCSGQILWSDV
jgi:hypothetical protein